MMGHKVKSLELRPLALSRLLELLAHLVLGLKNFLMENLKEVLASLQHVFVDILGPMPRHILVPDIDQDENIFDPHLL